MANMIKKNNDPSAPEPNHTGQKMTAFIFLLTAVFSGLIYLGTHSYAAFAVGCISLFICFLLFMLNLSFPTEKTEIKRFGETGERMTGSILERYLPDSYTVIQNAKVTYKGETSEIDNIIIGKTGVFVVEVKHMKGTITGNYEWHDWLQNKIDQYDIEHQKGFYSPVKQIGTHIYRLANYLKENKISTHINGAVYFSTPKTKVVVDGNANNIPVFTYNSTQALLDYIMNGTANLSEKAIDRIIQLLS